MRTDPFSDTLMWNYVFLMVVHGFFIVTAAGRSLGVDAQGIARPCAVKYISVSAGMTTETTPGAFPPRHGRGDLRLEPGDADACRPRWAAHPQRSGDQIESCSNGRRKSQ